MQQDHTYKITEIVGSSKTSVEDAVRTAIARAGKTLHGMKWFEVVETRGWIDGDQIGHWQVTLKVGFVLEG
ncbi:MAG: dodecin [Pseudomonadota bacterium]|jgi:dodecin|nr:dodecin family protein [Gammaproteobacteria bacterium]MEC9356993.1 dodecin [Pseudomonadota bacterium]